MDSLHHPPIIQIINRTHRLPSHSVIQVPKITIKIINKICSILTKKFTLDGNIIGEICTICLDELNCNDIIHDLDCNHYFHKKCSSEWFTHKNTCPICRANVF